MKPRIAIFDNWWTFHVEDMPYKLTSDEPTAWAKFLLQPRLKITSRASDRSDYDLYVIDDQSVLLELERLFQFKTCPICRTGMSEVTDLQSGLILLCQKCGYWGGRGTRDWGNGRYNARGTIGRYTPLETLNDEQFEYLVSHLRKHPKDVIHISPKKAESFVMDLIKDSFGCEIKKIGGTKDGGVDGYILRGDNIKTLVQIKWRQSVNKAESVSVVREVGGTMLARNIPNGLIVSNRKRFSKDAINESQIISKRVVKGIGKMNLELNDYHNILDMLEITNSQISKNFFIRDWLKFQKGECIFDGRFYGFTPNKYPDIIE